MSRHFRHAERGETKVNPLKRLLGVELELSAVSDSDVLTTFAETTGSGLLEDGSLPDSGVEIVTPPTGGDKFAKLIKSVSAVLPRCGAEITDECGLHVHVDARDFTQADLRRVVLLYSSVEQTLFNIVSRTRHGNHYCRPSGKLYMNLLNRLENGKEFSKQWRKELNTCLYSQNSEIGKHIRSQKRDQYNSARYYALNLHTFFFRQTIEFRMHESSLESDVLANWPLLCGWIVDAAFRMSERDIYALIARSETGLEVLNEILPASVADWITKRLDSRKQARIKCGTQDDTEQTLRENFSGPRDVCPSNQFSIEFKETEVICAV